MVDVASVPLMDDVEGEEEGVGRKDMEGGGIDSDFSYNNNVAGASKHVRLGERTALERFDTIVLQGS